MYFLKRLITLAPVLLVISFLAFLLVRLAPGGPFDKDRKPASLEVEKRLQAKYHLDEPVLMQYARFIGGLVRGDLGPSLKFRNHTVTDIIAQGLPVSLTLGMMAFCFAMGLGLPLGFYAAIRRGRWQDFASSFAAMLAVCIPGFVMGPFLVMVLAVHLGWFPVALWETPMHAVLPVIALGIYFAGKVARLMREGMTSVLQEPFITTARAKGLTNAAVYWRHAFRLGILPVVSYAGPLLADLLTGSFVVENIFQIPGIGVFMVNSSLNRDYPMVVGLVMVYAVLLVGLNLVVDVVYAALDPRVRYS